MSADNWAVCPRCEGKRQASLAEREAAVSASYGKVPVDEFDRARAELAPDKAETPSPTFREDYEIYGADEGEVTVEYRGGCVICGLRVEFKHAHPLDVTGGAS